MKKCPICEKTFDDSMRFCQVDGTPLVDDVPAFDPYATIVAQPIPKIEADAAVEAAPVEASAPEVVEVEPVIHQTVSSIPIAEPDDVLDLPRADPLKTMYVSDAEMAAALNNAAAQAEPDVMDMPPIETAPAPEPPSFSVPDVPAPSFGNMVPPPSPFSSSEPVVEEPVYNEPAPYEEPAPAVFETPAAEPSFEEAATMIQPSFNTAYDTPPAAPVAEWTPPPAPDASWQNQEIGANTPFQPPPSGTVGQNTTLGLVSLVLGILSFVCLYGIGGVAAIVLGIMQRSKIKNNPNEYGGGGLAMAGIILGLINILSFLGFIVLYAGLILASMR
ncbi:hypothetical protein BH10ACI3_BH10ACI3_15350 [soil metagenome]